MKLIRYISLALLLPLLFSCGKDQSLEKPLRPLSFSPAVTVETKAARPDNRDILVCDGSKVRLYGIVIEDEQTLSETISIVFNNQLLSCTENAGYFDWDYNPLQYWGQTGHYYFAGVFPYDDIDVTNTNNTLNIQYGVGYNTDLMVARSYRNVEDSTSIVKLRFRHACSAVRVLFGIHANAQDSSYKITDFRFENLVANGTLAIPVRTATPLVDDNPPVSSSNWNRGNITSHFFEWPGGSGDQPVKIGKPNNINNPDNYTIIDDEWYYMIPQTMTASAAIHFSASHFDGSSWEAPVTTTLNIYDVTGDISGGDGVADVWSPNQIYNYYILLKQSGLTVTVVTTPWDEVQVTTDVITFEPN